MTPHVVYDKDCIFVRITKNTARKKWGKEKVVLCPVRLRPGGGFHPHVTYLPNDPHDTGFEQSVEDFTSYNCSREVGYYPAFYLLVER